MGFVSFHGLCNYLLSFQRKPATRRLTVATAAFLKRKAIVIIQTPWPIHQVLFKCHFTRIFAAVKASLVEDKIKFKSGRNLMRLQSLFFFCELNVIAP